ncbi:MAG: imidazolonepropionase [Brucellaceae bacterium]|nr:imidazolonepropionase [Brucellaceae bacterium]
MDRLLTNLDFVTCDPDGLRTEVVSDGAIAIRGGDIAWCGRADALPDAVSDLPHEDMGGRLITPGLIDCHTHIVFGGNRAREFEMRLEGASYEEIARAGGGILSTVAATRAASEDELLTDALTRADALIDEGVTTIEIKSGYGLDIETELKMLRVARRIGELRPVRVVTSFLGAHATPPEYKGRNRAYLEEVCLPALEAAAEAGLADAVDGFCEGIAFSPDEIALVFDKAKALGLPVKLHAEQLSDLGGATLAARYEALSAEHLEYLGADGVRAMAEASMVAVMAPGAFYTLRETQLPPIEAFRAAGVPMAVATDCNPGSSPLASLLTAMNMACTLFRMTPSEVLMGVTAHAAHALGLIDRGIIASGMTADLAVWNVAHPAELSYRIGFNALHARIFGGAA